MNELLPKISLTSVVSEPADRVSRRRRHLTAPTVDPKTQEDKDQLSYYSVSMCHVVRSALWKLGGDIQKVSEMLDIPMETLTSWKKKFPEFKTACKDGIERSTQEIENALRSVAVPHDEVLEVKGADGKVAETTTRKAVVDTKAAIAVLKAKGDADWKGSKSGGGITGTKINVNFNTFSNGAQTKPTTMTVEAKPIEPDEESDGSD